MGLVGYVDRDRENNRSMSESIMSEYGVSSWKKIIGNDVLGEDDKNNYENTTVPMYMYNEFPFPREYKNKLIEIVDDFIDEWLIVGSSKKFRKDKIYADYKGLFSISVDKYIDRLLELTKKAYGLNRIIKFKNNDEFKMGVIIYSSNTRKELIDSIEVMYSCRGEAIRSMSDEDIDFLLSYDSKIDELKNEIDEIKKAIKIKADIKVLLLQVRTNNPSDNLDNIMDLYKSNEYELDELNSKLQIKTNELEQLSSNDNKEKLNNLFIWAFYGNMRGKGKNID